MDAIEERCKRLTEEVVKIQEDDIQEVLDTLGMSIEEARAIIELIHYKGTNVDVEYQIINKNTLGVYKHRKIDVNLFNGLHQMQRYFK